MKSLRCASHWILLFIRVEAVVSYICSSSLKCMRATCSKCTCSGLVAGWRIHSATRASTPAVATPSFLRQQREVMEFYIMQTLQRYTDSCPLTVVRFMLFWSRGWKVSTHTIHIIPRILRFKFLWGIDIPMMLCGDSKPKDPVGRLTMILQGIGWLCCNIVKSGLLIVLYIYILFNFFDWIAVLVSLIIG